MHRLWQYWSFFIVTFLLLLAWKPSAAIAARCLSNQSAALLRFKQGLSLPGPESLISWREGSDCCNWEGVICEKATGFVIGLQLSRATDGADNSSRVDPSLFRLFQLRLLDLSRNQFDGPIPSRLVELRELAHLNLSNAGFSGHIPSALSHMRSLVSLDLSTGRDGSSFLELGNLHLSALLENLKRLRTLHLGGINIPMNGADCISVISSALPNLQELSLPNCFISGRMNESILQLKSLSYLDLRGNNLSSIPECFQNLTSLSFLSLRKCSLRGTFPSAIFTFPHLQILDISINPDLQGAFPARLPLGRKLQVLKLSSTGLGGSIPDSFGSLSELRVINMSNCNLTGSISLLLSKLTQLQSVDLSSNKLRGPIPPFFASTIAEIDLSSNAFSGPIPESFGELDGLERLSLQDNLLSGWMPSVLLNLPSLKTVDLSNNGLTGSLSQFTNASSLLETIDLSHNSLSGEIPTTITSLSRLYSIDLSHNSLSSEIPTTITSLPRLTSIDLSFNHFNGTINISLFMGMENLRKLDLSENRLTVVDGPCRHDQKEVAPLISLYLRSCNIHRFPEGICNQGDLSILDLSNNNMSGLVPSCLWGMSKLVYLNLSHNMLTTLERPSDVGSRTRTIDRVDLSSNLLGGDLSPLPLDKIRYMDISFNRLTSFTPLTKFSSPSLRYLFASNNKVSGKILGHFCSSQLELLDLSNNGMVGSIPSCLTSSVDWKVLDLSKNQLEGQIPDAFGGNCSLVTLNLNSNRLSGRVPTSLSKCSALHVLDLSNNEMTGEFPSWLGRLRRLGVLLLRSNNFYGPLVCPPYEAVFPELQILDVSSNNLGGTLDPALIRHLRGMIKREPKGHQAKMYGFDYEDRVTLTIDGRVIQVRTTALMTFMDLSNNHFTGDIPNEIGILEGLIVLNMSNNRLVGQMPGSLANLLQLESLDLSRNNLSGTIPTALAQLTFLSVLDLSFNDLQGRIPQVNQLSTFEAQSFEGNPGLCGPPLTRTCPDANRGFCGPPLTGTCPDAAPPKLNTTSNPKTDLMPLFIAAELGFIVGLASVLMPVFLVRRARWWWFRLVDTTIEWALRRLHLRSCIFFG